MFNEMYKKDDLQKCKSSMAEKEGFEPSQRFARSTPLAGEPLQPYLGISPAGY